MFYLVGGRKFTSAVAALEYQEEKGGTMLVGGNTMYFVSSYGFNHEVSQKLFGTLAAAKAVIRHYKKVSGLNYTYKAVTI